MKSVLRINCLVVGDAGVGKSQLCGVMKSDRSHFSDVYSMTTSMDICSRIINLSNQHVPLEIFLMDTSGRDVFFEMNRKQWSDPSLLVVVFDLSSRSSFDNVPKWLQRVNFNKHSMPCILVGNKSDLTLRRVVASEEGKAEAEKQGMHYMETSAKEKSNVKEALQYLASQYLPKEQH